MLITRKFNATSVYKDGDKKATVIEYPKSPVTSAGLQILDFNKNLNVNEVTFRNCSFLVNPENNQKYLLNVNGRHVVRQESDLYVVTAFPYGSDIKSGEGFAVITTLPKGLVMRSERTATGSIVYHFEGLNLALFDRAPSLN